MTLNSLKHGGSRVFSKRLLQNSGLFIQGHGLHVRESAQDEVFVFGLASQPYVPIKGKGKSSSFLKTTQNLPKSNHQNCVSLWVKTAGELEHLPYFKL